MGEAYGLAPAVAPYGLAALALYGLAIGALAYDDGGVPYGEAPPGGVDGIAALEGRAADGGVVLELEYGGVLLFLLNGQLKLVDLQPVAAKAIVAKAAHRVRLQRIAGASCVKDHRGTQVTAASAASLPHTHHPPHP